MLKSAVHINCQCNVIKMCLPVLRMLSQHAAASLQTEISKTSDIYDLLMIFSISPSAMIIVFTCLVSFLSDSLKL